MVKSDTLVRFALDSRQLKDSCFKMRPHVLNMEKLPNQSSVEITGYRTTTQLIFSKVDQIYAYWQKNVYQEKTTKRICIILKENYRGLL